MTKKIISSRNTVGYLVLAFALGYLAVVSYCVGLRQAQHLRSLPVSPNGGVVLTKPGIGESGRSSSLAAEELATRTAIVAAATQPVVIGLKDSGQWPFYQAMLGGEKVKALGIRVHQNMQSWIMNDKYPDWYERNCSLQGVPIECIFTTNKSRFATADGMYFHTPRLPYVGSIMKRQHPKQIRFAVSLESDVHYPWINDPAYMCQFEAEATYRMCSQAPLSMHHETQHDFVTGANMVHAPVPFHFEQKVDAVAYINSNCNAPSGRDELITQWMHLKGAKVRVHSYGNCNKNMRWPLADNERPLTKKEIFQRYKFCIAMENSISHDYITEKVWDALSAGCIPIYMGSNNILQIMPQPHAIVLYGENGNVSSVAELDVLVHRIMHNRTEFEHMLAWKGTQVHELSPGYQQHLRTIDNTNECRMCLHIIKKRMANDFTRDTTCLWNQAWLKEAGMPFQNYSCPDDDLVHGRSDSNVVAQQPTLDTGELAMVYPATDVHARPQQHAAAVHATTVATVEGTLGGTGHSSAGSAAHATVSGFKASDGTIIEVV